jgi:hypothetical protein
MKAKGDMAANGSRQMPKQSGSDGAGDEAA